MGLATNQKYKKGTTVTLRVYVEPPEPMTDMFGEVVTDENGQVVYVTEPETEETSEEQ